MPSIRSDVDAFVAGWLNENLVNNIRVGDLDSRMAGDLNFDGITDLSDAFELHEALAAGGSGLDFSLLAAAVPEPSTLLLLILAAVIAHPLAVQVAREAHRTGPFGTPAGTLPVRLLTS